MVLVQRPSDQYARTSHLRRPDWNLEARNQLLEAISRASGAEALLLQV
ncbi:hypothetical protein SLEP1_g15487 [Rubroshorea leprosula]|uniref:Uncharacterized protein n=1 Tax=Rubroshorea leprosula TaxID=152421 RepID=A0AAV5IWX1_9ROSI|nr:hypothetical protein SLEP1_g15487 [Rubroshorea leprosula]